MIESQVSDEQIILDYRGSKSELQKAKLFKKLLTRKRGDRDCWRMVIKKYVSWRLMRSKNTFDIYNGDDLYQRCLCCFYKAIAVTYSHDKNTKFSTYMYSALKKTINRVIKELRKKKRTVEINVTDEKKLLKSIEDDLPPFKKLRLSPHIFTDSLQSHRDKNDDKSIVLGDIITEHDIVEQNDDITDNEELIIESILLKCQKYLSPMEYDIFIKGDIQGLLSGKDLAEKYSKSEPTISSIKKRKIARTIKKIREEIFEEFRLNCK
jgi:RNA polymerase sigma factor (sigma-70 family)